MPTADHLGPMLREVAPDDAQALEAMFAEQRARVAVVRENFIWHWFGDVPSGFGSPRAQLRGVYLQLAFVALVAAALIVAGFTRGPVLWCVLAAALLCLLVREIVLTRPARATMRLFGRAVLVPAVIVARVRDPGITDIHVPLVFALLSTSPPTAASFAALLATGDRLRQLVDSAEPAPAELAATVAAIRSGAPRAAYDGSRVPVAALGGLELARFYVPPGYMPGGELTSRLVFVLADPEARTANSTRVVQTMLWGEGGESLVRALPWSRS